MSKKVHKQRVAKQVWLQVLHDHDEYFQKPWEALILRKLKDASFTKVGGLKMNGIGHMIVSEFPTLYKFWKERMIVKDNA